jgi:hypothetical protein
VRMIGQGRIHSSNYTSGLGKVASFGNEETSNPSQISKRGFRNADCGMRVAEWPIAVR